MAFVGLPALALAAPASPPDLPPPGGSLERTLEGGATDRYEKTLAAGTYLLGAVEQKGIDVALRLLDPRGKAVFEMDSPNGTAGPEPLAVVVEDTGAYVLEVFSQDPTAAAGGYLLTVEALRQATPSDRQRARATKLMARAAISAWRGTPETLREALRAYEEALSLWRGVGDRRAQAEVFVALGRAHGRLEEPAAALERFRQGLALQEQLGDPAARASTLNAMGLVLQQQGETEAARRYLAEALTIFAELGDVPGMARTHNNLGLLEHAMGRLGEALEHYGQALDRFTELHDEATRGVVLNNLGGVFDLLGEWGQALDHYHRSLPILTATDQSRRVALVLNNLAVVHQRRGEWQPALDRFEQARQAFEELEDPRGIRTTQLNRSALLAELGDAQGCLQGLAAARALPSTLPRQRAEEHLLAGRCSGLAGRWPQSSAELEEALEVFRKMGDRIGESDALRALGETAEAAGDLSTASRRLRQGMGIARQTHHGAGVLRCLQALARITRQRGELPRAVELDRQALALALELGEAESELAARYSLALELRGLGDRRQASEELDIGIRHFETRRAELVSPELRTSYFATGRRLYRLRIELLMEEHRENPAGGFSDRAFALAERSRMRTLGERLARADLALATPDQDPLRIEHRRLQRQIRAAALQRRRGPAPGQETDLDRLVASLDEVEARLRRQDGALAFAYQPETLSLRRAQEDLLDPQTLLLVYSLGESRSFLWAVSATSSRVVDLPGREALEGEASRLHRLWSTLDPADRREQEAAGQALSRTLLGPVEDWLRGEPRAARRHQGRRLLIVPDGGLHVLPFGALPVPSSPQGSPLLAEHEISVLPSASVLALLRERASLRARASDRASETLQKSDLAIFADPVFGRSDPRLADFSAEESSSPEDSNRYPAVPGLSRLAGSRAEAAAIRETAGPGQVWERIGFDASLSALEAADLRSFRRLHFATHAVLNEERPALSAIVLSQVDRHGHDQDGLLTLERVYGLDLDAELVVLSACRTALGKAWDGEGLVGLTHGFLAAGASAVAATLWQVDDRATTEVMAALYRGLLQQDLSPAAALQGAQLELLRRERWRDPYYWAPFLVVGDGFASSAKP